MTKPRKILGIESSCDDTAAAVVSIEPDQTPKILSSVVFGQNELHAEFGGVVPEIAARAHAERVDQCVAQALDKARLDLRDLDAAGKYFATPSDLLQQTCLYP